MNTSEAIRAIQQIEQEYAEDLNEFKSDKAQYDTKIKKSVLDQVEREDAYIKKTEQTITDKLCNVCNSDISNLIKVEVIGAQPIRLTENKLFPELTYNINGISVYDSLKVNILFSGTSAANGEHVNWQVVVTVKDGAVTKECEWDALQISDKDMLIQLQNSILMITWIKSIDDSYWVDIYNGFHTVFDARDSMLYKHPQALYREEYLQRIQQCAQGTDVLFALIPVRNVGDCYTVGKGKGKLYYRVLGTTPRKVKVEIVVDYYQAHEVITLSKPRYIETDNFYTRIRNMYNREQLLEGVTTYNELVAKYR